MPYEILPAPLGLDNSVKQATSSVARKTFDSFSVRKEFTRSPGAPGLTSNFSPVTSLFSPYTTLP